MSIDQNANAQTPTKKKDKSGGGGFLSPRKSKTEQLLEAKLSVLSTEFQDFVNTLETELAQVKEQWREECTKNKRLADEQAASQARVALLEAELAAEKKQSEALRKELEDMMANVSLQNFVRGFV